ncbi:phenylalanine--tRNA ligase subunit beta [Candidatus Saccharibacteria bacterium]|nr:phenylalanine--tRNA ligase subunit beta [Candidatus Saccharibacteria bacterium]
MIVSLNWLKEYVDIDVSVEELGVLIGARLVEIEGKEDWAEKYAGVVIVKVVECEGVEGSDHLSLCRVDDGGVVEGMERGEDGLVKVVCGAPNAKAGMMAVWLPPGVVVPETWGDDEPFVLEARKLRGHVSNGMLASMKELGLGEEHDGIVDLGSSTRASETQEDLVGRGFAERFGLDDVLLDVENKSLTHRPDCFGVVGFAREVAGILGKKFETPEWLQLSETKSAFAKSTQAGISESLDDVDPAEGKLRHYSSSNQDQKTDVAKLAKLDSASTELLAVKIIDSRLCPRYQAVVLEAGEVKEGRRDGLSEEELKLVKAGMRVIDPIVDLTNYLMLLIGQPLHAFDYDKLVEVGGLDVPKIIVRAAKDGEEIELLDGRTVKCDTNDILITSNDVPVALAGAMGCANTVIDEGTKRIIVESATFSLYNLRRTQMKHGIFSEAITRFTKGQPAELTDPVVREFVRRMEGMGYEVVSEVVDCYPVRQENPVIEVSVEEVNGLLGTDYSWRAMEETLRNVEFEVWCECGEEGKCKCEKVNVRAPYWRTDVRIREDVIEEVGRLLGYDSVPMGLPMREFRAVRRDELGELKARIRGVLSSGGANEVLTYGFVHGDLIRKAGQDVENSYQLTNSISPELEYLRQSIVPSLLEKAQMNLKAGYEKFGLFEMNRVSPKHFGVNEEGVPVEKNKLAMVVVDRKGDGAYYEAKKYVEFLMRKLGVKVEFVAMKEKLAATSAPFEMKRTAEVRSLDGEILGIVGEFTGGVRRAFKLSEGVAGFELGVDVLLPLVSSLEGQYRKMSRYQGVERDLTVRVSAEVEYGEILKAVEGVLAGKGLEFEVEPVSIWQGEDLSTKNVSLRLKFASFDGTLGKEEISEVMDSVVDGMKKVGAEVV